MGQLPLAGEIAAAINGVIGGWLRRITVSDADPALRITQSGDGDGLRVEVGSDAFRVCSGGVARAPRLEIDDASTYLDKDASNNLTLTDAVTGTKTLAELAAGGGGGDHQIQRVVRTEGNYSTTSTSWVDIDSANLSITMTTGASWVRITLQANTYNSLNDHNRFDLTIDGTRQGQTLGLVNVKSDIAHGFQMVWETQVSAGSHTFRPQWRVYSGTGWLFASTTTWPILFVVEELK